LSEKFANFISIIFHPLLIPTYIFGVIFYLAPEVISNLQSFQSANNQAIIQIGFKENLLFLLFLCTFLMPASVMYYLYKIKIVPSLKMEELSTRRIPYFFTFLFYLIFGFFIKYKLELLSEISLAIFSISICLFIIFLISLFWKISAHLTGIGGAVGLFIAIYLKKGADSLFFPIIISIILAGIIASARLKLNAHNNAQIVAGFTLGFVISVISILIYL
jgi:membrane-associated phospholipid phosphatase